MVPSNGQIRTRTISDLCVHLNYHVSARWFHQITRPEIAKKENVPGAVQIPATPLSPPTLHLRSSDVTLVTGLLFGGIRVQVLASSTLWDVLASKNEMVEKGKWLETGEVKPYPLTHIS